MSALARTAAAFDRALAARDVVAGTARARAFALQRRGPRRSPTRTGSRAPRCCRASRTSAFNDAFFAAWPDARDDALRALAESLHYPAAQQRAGARRGVGRRRARHGRRRHAARPRDGLNRRTLGGTRLCDARRRRPRDDAAPHRAAARERRGAAVAPPPAGRARRPARPASDGARRRPHGRRADPAATLRAQGARAPAGVPMRCVGIDGVHLRAYTVRASERAGAAARVRAFAFATRLTDLTTALRRTSGVQASRALARRVRDFGGGTRIGAALREFNDAYAQRGVHAAAATVAILSDGWERGDPALVGRRWSASAASGTGASSG